MAASEWHDLIDLLAFVANTSLEREHPQGQHIVRASNLHVSELAPLQRRNVLFVTGQFPSPLHGGGARVADFIKCISPQHDVYLYSWSSGVTDALASREIAPFCKRVATVPTFEFTYNLGRLKTWLGDIPMDIVHYEWPRSLRNFDRAVGKRHIFTYMECVSLRLLLDLAFETQFSDNWFRKIIDLLNMLKLEIVDAARVDLLITVTQKDAEFLARFTPRRSYIVMNHGVIFEDFCLPDREPERHTIVFVGNFVHYPNVDAARFFITEILPLVARQEPNVKFYLVGTDPTNQLDCYRRHPQVVVTGEVNDVRPYIQNASVCVAPLITGAGLRSKVIQYGALKRTCVSTSIGVTDLVFEHGTDILVADDPATFARDVVHLLQHPEISRRMGESACEKVKSNYDNRRLAAYLNDIYETLERDS
jgi:glycosyltransferase involved in cell wall biosynthesis